MQTNHKKMYQNKIFTCYSRYKKIPISSEKKADARRSQEVFDVN